MRRANAADHPIVRMLHTAKRTENRAFAYAWHLDLAGQGPAATQMLYYYITVFPKKQAFFRIFFNPLKIGPLPPRDLWKNTAKTEKRRLRDRNRRLACSDDCLLLLRSTDRTCICAGAALETCVRINLILAVALRDRADRTCICTCTALDASIADYVCHDLLPPVKMIMWLCVPESGP